MVTDAHLAALAVEYGATLCTNDVGFRGFAGVRVAFPLLG
jgi:predicted nucleic acid-binding protein